MIGERPQATRVVLARLHGELWHHARWEPPDEETTAAAVAGLREILEGRGDGPELLAEEAGLLLGFHEGGLHKARARNTAGFCIAAGADGSLIPQWQEVGRQRAASARMPPPSGGMRPRG